MFNSNLPAPLVQILEEKKFIQKLILLTWNTSTSRPKILKQKTIRSRAFLLISFAPSLLSSDEKISYYQATEVRDKFD